MAWLLPASRLDDLLSQLATGGREIFGPTARDGAVMNGRIHSAEDLPRGLGETQLPGHYRLEETGDGRYFGYTVGPDGYKRVVHPARERHFSVALSDDGTLSFQGTDDPAPICLFGMRACDLAGLGVLDGALGEVDPRYAARRGDVLLVAAQCERSAATCFCASMGTGPRIREPFDLSLTEVLEGGDHHFVVEVGSKAGQSIVDALGLATVDSDAPERAAEQARQQQTKTLDVPDLPSRLQAVVDSPAWDKITERCLGCANCTMVCPTCFCSTVDDVTDLDGDAHRQRRWDSCFNLDFSYIHGGPVRRSLAARYRQWLTHKLSTWHDQFGTSGCVGCGRCITWCPAGIDITAEARRMVAEEEHA